MAYINLQRQREIRERWQVAVLTKLRPDMNLPDEFDAGPVLTCEQGQRLEWLGLDGRAQLHWFGVQESEPLCARCWQASECPREFAFAPDRHEILYGSIPLSSRVAQILLTRVRPWIEASQAYEKNQLGLSRIFLNSLRLAWNVGLLADTVALLRAHASVRQSAEPALLHQLAPQQAVFPFE
jgi:hypothetical protein